MRLLIVDDEELTCRGMQARILEMGFASLDAVDAAFSAEEALELARSRRVDILLTDVRMVNLNGLELIEAMQKLYPHVCCIIMTAYANFEYAHQAIKLGVKAFLLKPFSREEMYETISAAIRTAMETGGVEQANANKTSDPISWAKEYVRERLHEEISMAQVANELNLSYNYFSKLFKQQTGQSFIAYVTDEKMKLAGQMLRAGQKTTEVARALGYPIPQNFTRAFSRYWGCTPGEYRKNPKG